MRYQTLSARVMIAVLMALALPSGAYAACSNPAGEEGVMIYNKNHNTAQFCDGTSWIDMGAGGNTLDKVLSKGNDAAGQDAVNFGKLGIGTSSPSTKLDMAGGRISDVADPTNAQDAATKGWVENNTTGAITQKENKGSKVSIPLDGSNKTVLSMTVNKTGDYLIFSNAIAGVDMSWGYFSTNCKLYLNGSSLEISQFYYGTGQDGSSPRYTHHINLFKTLSAGDTLSIGCNVSTDSDTAWVRNSDIRIISF